MLLFFRSLFLGVGIALLSSGFVHRTPPTKKQFLIESGSRLYLKGSSNVNQFTCDCQERFFEQILEADTKDGYARFKNAELSLRTKKLDCHNNKIDADLQKALKADQYPHIKVALVDCKQNAKQLDGKDKNWFDVHSNVLITITHTTKKEYIAAKARMLGPDQVQITGEKAIQMSAYGVTPPEAMFGMIKVNDWITLHFDLIVSIKPV
jgi:hypothetical protein